MNRRLLTFLSVCSLFVAACDGSGGGGGDGGSGGAGGGVGGNGGSGGSGGTAQFCYNPLADMMFNQTCTVAADCAVKFHMIDCCGSLAAVGINQTDVSNFDMQEATCQAICDCVSQPTIADDNNSSADPAAFQVDCLMGKCSTFVQ